MKFDSPLFDRIRVKPGEDRRVRTSCPICDWPGCAGPATHRAPKGRLREGEYWRFCLDHVREYNQSYNFFAGMSDDAIARYHKEAITGHRPTWKIGVNGAKSGLAGGPQAAGPHPYEATDPFNLFGDFGRDPRWRPVGERLGAEGRVVRNAERKAFDTLGLDADATATDIKARFKLLVKRHHPDANGGDRSCEDRLREIIQAYNYLKSVGWG
jgi:DnaJ domain